VIDQGHGLLAHFGLKISNDAQGVLGYVVVHRNGSTVKNACEPGAGGVSQGDDVLYSYLRPVGLRRSPGLAKCVMNLASIDLPKAHTLLSDLFQSVVSLLRLTRQLSHHRYKPRLSRYSITCIFINLMYIHRKD
jgi:hypothetical protein